MNPTSFLQSFECFAVIVRMDGVAMKRALVAGSAGNIIAASPTAVVDVALFRVRAFRRAAGKQHRSKKQPTKNQIPYAVE